MNAPDDASGPSPGLNINGAMPPMSQSGQFWRKRMAPALLQGGFVGIGMGLFAWWGGFNPLLIGGLAGAATVILILRYPQG